MAELMGDGERVECSWARVEMLLLLLLLDARRWLVLLHAGRAKRDLARVM